MRGTLIQRTLVWLAGLALPATPILRIYMHHIVRALMCAIGAAILFSAVFIGVLGAAFIYFTGHGYSPLLVGAGIGGVMLVSAMVLAVKISAHIAMLAAIKSDMQLFGGSFVPPPVDLPVHARSFGAAFLDGLMTPSPVVRAEQAAARAERAEAEARLHERRAGTNGYAAGSNGAGGYYHAARSATGFDDRSFY